MVRPWGPAQFQERPGTRRGRQHSFMSAALASAVKLSFTARANDQTSQPCVLVQGPGVITHSHAQANTPRPQCINALHEWL